MQEILILAGRWLCNEYFKGGLKPSATYLDGGARFRLSRCVEKVLEDEHNRRGKLGEVWRQLMSGDLAKLNTVRRSRVLGGRASLRTLEGDKVEIGVDGGELREMEVLMYFNVGLEFKKLVM